MRYMWPLCKCTERVRCKLDLKIKYITKMVKYSCERYGKGFSQKSHYDSHNRRKTPFIYKVCFTF